MDEQTNNANLGKIADLSTKSIIDRNLRQRKKKRVGIVMTHKSHLSTLIGLPSESSRSNSAKASITS